MNEKRSFFSVRVLWLIGFIQVHYEWTFVRRFFQARYFCRVQLCHFRHFCRVFGIRFLQTKLQISVLCQKFKIAISERRLIRLHRRNERLYFRKFGCHLPVFNLCKKADD